MLVLSVEVPLAARANRLFQPVIQVRVNMLRDPFSHINRTVFHCEQLIHGCLRGAEFKITRDRLAFPVLLHQVFPFPSTFKIFELLVFHRNLIVTA